MKPLVYTIDSERLQPDIISTAANLIRDGGVAVLPTRGLYGLGADAFNASAAGRIFTIKNRPTDKPLLVLIGHRRMLSQIVAEIPPMAASIMDAFWPGRITLVMQGRQGLPQGLHSSDGKVGVRLVEHPVAAALVNAVGSPVTGTSANLSGQEGCSRVGEIDETVLASVDLVLDAGPLDGGPGSTIVDVTGDTPCILREGAVSTSAVMAAFDAFVSNSSK